MRVLVLGATGFIGGQIMRAAHAEGWELHGLRRRAGAVGVVGDLPIMWHDGDLLQTDALRAAMQGIDMVYHAAGFYPKENHALRPALRRAVSEMRSVLAAVCAAGVPRLIYTSSLSTVGAAPAGEDRLADERDGYLPGSAPSAYYEAKWLMEHEALRAAFNGLHVITLIPTAVFGPEDEKPTTSEIVLEIARGHVPLGIDMQVNFVDGRDVAQAHIAAATKGESGQRYLIGGHNLNVTDMIRETAEIAGVKPPRIVLSQRNISQVVAVARWLRLPVPDLMFGIDHFRALNTEKGCETFGFTPRPFAETARDTIQWFREHRYL